MRRTRSGNRWPQVVIAVLVALLAIPGAAFAQDTETPGTPEITEPTEPVEMARVRFLFGSPHGTLDVYVGGEIMLEGFELGQATDYMDVPAGKQLFEVTGQGMSLSEVQGSYGTGLFPNSAEATQKLKAGAAYTAVINTNGGGGTEFKFIKDNPKPKAGQAFVRVVSLCPVCGPINYTTAGSKKPLAKLHYSQDKLAGKYAKVKPGEVDLIPRIEGLSRTAFELDPITIEPGTSSSLFVIGENGAVMTLLPVVDAALSSARFMNASRMPPVLDVYVDGKKRAKRLAPGQAALKASNLLAGEHLVQVVEVGKKPADGTLAEATVLFPAGATAVEVGAGETIEAVAAPTAVAPKAKTPRIRFAHVDPEIPAVDIEIDGVDNIEGLAVGEWTDYITMPGDSSYLWVRPANTGGIYHEMPLDLGPGNSTAYLGGSPDIPSVDFVFVEDKVAKKKK